MIGFPKNLNTRADYENCHRMAISGEVDRAKMKAAWRKLIDTARVWAFKAKADAAYKPLANEKVMAEKRDGVDVYTCFAIVDDPNAEINKLAYTVTTVNQRIAELEVL